MNNILNAWECLVNHFPAPILILAGVVIIFFGIFLPREMHAVRNLGVGVGYVYAVAVIVLLFLNREIAISFLSSWNRMVVFFTLFMVWNMQEVIKALSNKSYALREPFKVTADAFFVSLGLTGCAEVILILLTDIENFSLNIPLKAQIITCFVVGIIFCVGYNDARVYSSRTFYLKSEKAGMTFKSVLAGLLTSGALALVVLFFNSPFRQYRLLVLLVLTATLLLVPSMLQVLRKHDRDSYTAELSRELVKSFWNAVGFYILIAQAMIYGYYLYLVTLHG